ncbi:hypothetical protein QAD02_005760 [Eretmocerus hayati]|uniref:Uncharacterized protein n=1 Tax=Eretmocerus hayati TaxID=131215 RepID=A0ACC2NTF4_9HYME|nr:hypothetical protein QAD02_005760 [Eretmocerus hayati]
MRRSPRHFNSRRNRVLKFGRNDLALHDPANFIHLISLSNILKRTLDVWRKDRVAHSFGKSFRGYELEIGYTDNSSASHLNSGHFTLKNKRKPRVPFLSYPNSCLYDAISLQTGIDPNELRRKVIRQLRKSRGRVSFSVSSCYDEVFRRGAKYKAESEERAKKILDASQKGKSHPYGKPGHPRGHVSRPRAKGPTESVENYSKNTWETGFLSGSDQDRIVHLCLKTVEAQELMELMNVLGAKAKKKTLEIPVHRLQMLEKDMPKAQNWSNGEKSSEPWKIRKVVLILRHSYEKYDVEDADVFITTVFPDNRGYFQK